MVFRILSYLIICLLLASCDSEKRQELLPDSVGNVGDIMIVADEAFWKSDYGKRYKKIFSVEQFGLPQSESSFNVVFLPINQFHGFAEKYRNIIFIGFENDATNASQYVRKSLGDVGALKVLADTARFFYLREDLKAKNQQLMFCYAPNPQIFVETAENQAQQLRDFFNALEIKRTAERLSRLPKDLNAFQRVKSKFGFSLSIPETYRLRVDSGNFIWLARDDADKSLGLLLFVNEYNGRQDFEINNLNTLRDSMTKALIPGPTPGSYMITEYELPVLTTTKALSGKYAVEMRGLWKVANDFMGGPMFHQAIYDEATNRVIHAVGFVYFPNNKKREWLREVEALVSTISF